MPDISIIILSFNEEIHIERCIEKVQPVAKDIFVVDSLSTDNTIKLAERTGVKVFQNKWPGNYSKQFNWALEKLPIETEWVLRLDADEYLYPELIQEIQNKLENLPKDVNGVVFKRRHIFLGKWMKRGTYPVKLLRLFRYKKAVCEERWMDEHIELLEGKSTEFEHDFADHNLNDLSWWSQKHVGYAIREAVDLLNIEFNWISVSKKEENRIINDQALAKRRIKNKYAKQPLFWRSFTYFIYRYILKGGFLDGKEGFLWHFLQGWWYRTLVDAKIYEIKKTCGHDKDKIRIYLMEKYSIEI